MNYQLVYRMTFYEYRLPLMFSLFVYNSFISKFAAFRIKDV